LKAFHGYTDEKEKKSACLKSSSIIYSLIGLIQINIYISTTMIKKMCPHNSPRRGIEGDGLFNNTALIGQNRCFHCDASEGMPLAQPLNTFTE
jgi:hypothetical protein